MIPFYGWVLTASRLQSYYEETVDLVSLSPQEFLKLIWSTSERWKAESNRSHAVVLNNYMTLNLQNWRKNFENIHFLPFFTLKEAKNLALNLQKSITRRMSWNEISTLALLTNISLF